MDIPLTSNFLRRCAVQSGQVGCRLVSSRLGTGGVGRSTIHESTCGASSCKKKSSIHDQRISTQPTVYSGFCSESSRLVYLSLSIPGRCSERSDRIVVVAIPNGAAVHPPSLGLCPFTRESSEISSRSSPGCPISTRTTFPSTQLCIHQPIYTRPTIHPTVR